MIGSDGMLQQEMKHVNETLLGLNRSIWCCSDPKCAIKLSVIGEIEWSILLQTQSSVDGAEQATWQGLAEESGGRDNTGKELKKEGDVRAEDGDNTPWGSVLKPSKRKYFYYVTVY